MTQRWMYVAITAAMGLAAAIVVWPYLGDDTGTTTVWVEGGQLLGVGLSTHLDSLAASMVLLVSGVALLVQIYSTAYLADDPRYRSYALLIILFLLAMIAVVVADDLFVLLIGWEVMGLCSYFLISHEWEKEPARAGAVKAYLITRFADLGLLIGIFVIGASYGTFRISEVVAQSPHNATPIALLLLLAVVGKSAQFPLHTWLPDAMPGPMPVSALIHAATMVAAGVYLVARLYPVFLASATALTVMALIACITMLMAALFALTGSDLKRILAWSTVSQLAYMFAAMSVGGREAGIDHLLSHGAFKALLFLAAGCIMYAIGSTSLSAMGGLRRSMPWTFAATTIGLAALAGIPPTSGFFSKDDILAAARQSASGQYVGTEWVASTVFVVSLITAFVTAAYAARVWFKVFFGLGKEARDAPRAMTVPLVVLAAVTIALSFGKQVHWEIGVLTSAITVVAIALAWWVHRGALTTPAVLRRALRKELGLDIVYGKWIPVVFNKASAATLVVDADAVDAYPRATAFASDASSRLLDRFQSKNSQTYATVLSIGVVAFTVLVAVWS